jgi:UDP-2,3-diacylglucosamine pyrophosphatase LpxH
MKIDIISDLHIDSYIDPHNTDKELLLFIEELIPKMPGDCLIIAGEISHCNKQISKMQQLFKKIYPRVFQVIGNHDMYLINNRNQQKFNWNPFERIQAIKDISLANGVELLDGDVHRIGDIKIGGLTGWYDLTNEDSLMNWVETDDFNNLDPIEASKFRKRFIEVKSNLPRWNTNKFYNIQMQKLDNIIENSCDILVSHVALLLPPKELMPPKFQEGIRNMFYYVDNFNEVKQTGCQVYIHGHTHTPYDYNFGGVRIVCNPFGRPDDNNSVIKIKQIDI